MNPSVKIIESDDIKFLIENAKPDAKLYQALDKGYQLIPKGKRLPNVGSSNIWPFVTMAFFQQLQSTIRIQVSGLHVYL